MILWWVERGCCSPVGVFSMLSSFISSCCPLSRTVTQIFVTVVAMKTAYIKNLLSLVINSVLKLLCSGRAI